MTTTQRPAWAEASPDMTAYYDEVWGRPVTDEHGAYARLVLESFQSGLSWRTVWAREAVFREVFAEFDPEVVAGYDDARIDELIADPRMIRNRRKIEAAVANARATLALRDAVPAPKNEMIEAGLSSLLWAYAVPTPGIASTLDAIGTPEAIGSPEAIGTDDDAAAAVPGTAAAAEEPDVPAATPESTALARDLKEHGFKHLGPVSVYAAMQAMGIVNDHPRGTARWQELETERARILGW